MLRVTELMIDDWVCINGSNYQVQDLKKKGVVKLYTTTKYGIHEIEFNTDYLEEEMNPIPLTPEILEKNGFKKVDKDLFHLGQSSIGVDTWLGIDNNVIYVDALYHDGEIAFCKCEYVHELQHALKLCGIEKKDSIMKEWQINSVICYVKAYNKASSFGGGLYVTENKEFVGDSFGPMGPGRYTPIEKFYKIVPLHIKINEFFKWLFK